MQKKNAIIGEGNYIPAYLWMIDGKASGASNLIPIDP